MIFLALVVVSFLIARLRLRTNGNALRDSAREGFGIAKGLSLAVLAAFALIGCGSSSPSMNETSVSGASTDVVVVMEGSSFKPKSITLHEGKETTVEVVNNDSVPHDFAIESLDLNTGTISPGKRVVRKVVPTKSTREFACTFHPGMKGRIEVV